MLRTTFFLLSFSMMLPVASAATRPVNQAIDDLRQNFGVPALTALRADKNGVTQVISGVRKAGDATPAHQDDAFHLGSCTKAMTATLLAMLIEDGVLSWGTTVADVFVDLAPRMHPDLRDVTVGMLTSHTSGLTGEMVDTPLWETLWDLNTSASAAHGRRVLAQTLLIQPPAYPPGTAFCYSNYGYMVLGAMLEELTGQPWEDLLRERLFKPLNMLSCGFGAPGHETEGAPSAPWAHDTLNDKSVPLAPGSGLADNPQSLGPAGTVHCSLRDWVSFAQLHMDGFNERPTALLSPASFARLHLSPVTQIDGT